MTDSFATCRGCQARFKEESGVGYKYCPDCGEKLSDVGKDISISVSDSIRISDEVFNAKLSRGEID